MKALSKAMIVLLVTVPVVAFTHARTPVPVASSAAVAALVSAADVDCTVSRCSDCEFFITKVLDNGNPRNDSHSPTYDCNSGWCGGCIQSFTRADPAAGSPVDVVVEQLAIAAKHGDTQQLTRLLGQDGRAYLNVARQSIQVMGCNGQIGANIPLRPALLSAVARAVEESAAGTRVNAAN